MTKKIFKPPKTVEGRYKRALMDLLNAFFGAIDPKILDSPTDLVIAFREFANTKAFMTYVRAAAARMVTGQAVETAKSWREAAKKSTHGRLIYESLRHEMQGPVGREVAHLIDENAKLISTFPDKVSDYVAHYVGSQQQKGRRAEDITKDLMERFPGFARSRLHLIARTESSKASTALTEARSKDLDLDFYIWQTSQDARVRYSHHKMQGIIVPWNRPPNPEALFPERGVKALEPYHAGCTFNCFPGSTQVSLSNGYDKIWKRRYIGKMVRIALSEKASFEVTPNHPILTRRSWIPAQFIKKGDYLIHADIQRIEFKHDVNTRIATFSEIFKSFPTTSITRINSQTEFDFHGDGFVNGEIEIISPASNLAFDTESFDLRVKNLGESIERASDPFNDFICGNNLFNLGSCVLDVDTSNFDGYVYGLQSNNGWYSIVPSGTAPINSIVVKNCRCYPDPLLDVDEITWPHRVFYNGSVQMMTKMRFINIFGFKRAM